MKAQTSSVISICLLAVLTALSSNQASAQGFQFEMGSSPTTNPEPREVSDAEPKRTADETPKVKRPRQRVKHTLWQLILKDRTRLRGRIISNNGYLVEFLLMNGTRRTIHRADIAYQRRYKPKKLKVVNGKIWETNPNRTRHLWSPSAMPLRAGEGYVSQKEALFTAVALGLTDNVAILFGSLLPALLVGKDGYNAIGAVKVADEVADDVYLGAGAEVFFMPSVGSIAFPFVSATLGKPDAQLTVNVGKAVLLEDSEPSDDGMMVSFCGMWRFSNAHGIVSENIIFPGMEDVLGQNISRVHGLAIRKIEKRSAWDLGIVMLGDEAAIPWFDYTWHLGD